MRKFIVEVLEKAQTVTVWNGGSDGHAVNAVEITAKTQRGAYAAARAMGYTPVADLLPDDYGNTPINVYVPEEGRAHHIFHRNGLPRKPYVVLQ